MTSHIHIGLGKLLNRHNVTLEQLAEAAHLRPATVRTIVHARVKRVKLGTLVDLVSGLRRLGIPADVGDILHVVDTADETEQAARDRALRLLGGDPWGLRPAGLAEPVRVSGPPIEELLPELLTT